MTALEVDYRDIRFEDFPHWFPKFDESEEAYQELFTDLMQRSRTAFPETITREFDDDKSRL